MFSYVLNGNGNRYGRLFMCIVINNFVSSKITQLTYALLVDMSMPVYRYMREQQWRQGPVQKLVCVITIYSHIKFLDLIPFVFFILVGTYTSNVRCSRRIP